MSIRDEFFIERHGKQYVLFAGLLDEAHNRGLRAIDTELIQAPAEENGQVAIVKARVEMENDTSFSGIGDASPDNVGRNIAPHIIRMAETRSKARALRDAVNVGAAALEELGDEDQASAPGTTISAPPASGAYLGLAQDEAAEEPFAQASPATIDRLRSMVTDRRGPNGVSAMEDHLGHRLEELTAEQALGWLERFSGKG